MAFVLFQRRWKTVFQVINRSVKLYSENSLRVSFVSPQFYQQEAKIPEDKPILAIRKESKETPPSISVATVLEATKNIIQMEKVIQVDEVEKVEVRETNNPSLQIHYRYNVNSAMDYVPMPSYNNSLTWDHMSSLYT